MIPHHTTRVFKMQPAGNVPSSRSAAVGKCDVPAFSAVKRAASDEMRHFLALYAGCQ